MSDNKTVIEKLKKKYKKTDSKLRDSSSIGMRLFSELFAAILLGLGLGYVLDEFLETSPWGIISLLFLFLAGAVYNIFKELNNIQYDTSKMDIVPEEDDEDSDS